VYCKQKTERNIIDHLITSSVQLQLDDLQLDHCSTDECAPWCKTALRLGFPVEILEFAHLLETLENTNLAE
jgi:hypothetical protein